MDIYHGFLPSETAILDSREARGGGCRDLDSLWRSYRSMVVGERGLLFIVYDEFYISPLQTVGKRCFILP